jgi:predicted transcriptional regulator
MRNQLKGLFTEYWEYLAIQTACKTNILDYIAEGSNTVESILLRKKFNEKVLVDLLNALEQSGILIIDGQKITLTDQGSVLTENHPKSLKYACIHWGEESLSAWQNLEYTLATGKPAFEEIYGEAMFDYLSSRKDKLANYHKAMDEYARDDYEFVAEEIDFVQYKSVMDVGGGLGALIKTVKKNNPNLDCMLYEKPEVIELCNLENIRTIGGSFFENIPQLADCLILSRIIHDWDDEKALQILANCYSALPDEGAIIIVENFVDRIDNKAALLSLNMELICKSFERTEVEYVKLLNKAGFEIDSIKQLNELQYIIKAKK